jgi:transcriptional regulator with XRE-family HTH domain
MAVPDSTTPAEAPRRRAASARREAHSVTAGLGERIKALRTERGLSLRSVAAEAQVSPSLLSQIERGEASPSLISLVAIADALDVRPGRLLEDNAGDQPAPSPVVRREERRVVDDPTCRREYLMHLDDPYLEVAELIVAPGGESRPTLASHSGRDYGIVITGEIVIEFEDGRAETLKRGDYIAFDADVPHRAVNRSGRQARVLWIIAHDRSEATRQRRSPFRAI